MLSGRLEFTVVPPFTYISHSPSQARTAENGISMSTSPQCDGESVKVSIYRTIRITHCILHSIEPYPGKKKKKRKKYECLRKSNSTPVDCNLLIHGTPNRGASGDLRRSRTAHTLETRSLFLRSSSIIIVIGLDSYAGSCDFPVLGA